MKFPYLGQMVLLDDNDGAAPQPAVVARVYAETKDSIGVHVLPAHSNGYPVPGPIPRGKMGETKGRYWYPTQPDREEEALVETLRQQPEPST